MEQITFAGGNWSAWNILAAIINSTIYFGSILRVLAVFPGFICSAYAGYCKVRTSDVCTAGAACVLGVLYTAHHVPNTRSIWAFSIVDTPSTRSINLAQHNTRVPQYFRYQQYPEYRTETDITSSIYREYDPLSTDRYS